MPQEMMAAGLPVFDLKVESTEAIYPSDVISLMEPDSDAIALTLDKYMQNIEYLQKQAINALDWVSQFSWERAGGDFEKALLYRLAVIDSHSTLNSYRVKAIHKGSDNDRKTPYKASVVIPTYNGGDMLRTVLEAVASQSTPWDLQCVIIDSGSKDETLDICKKFTYKINAFDIYTIPNEEFQHGYTRNVGVDLSQADYVAFITPRCHSS